MTKRERIASRWQTTVHLQPPEPKKPGVPSRAISFAKLVAAAARTRSPACWRERDHTAAKRGGVGWVCPCSPAPLGRRGFLCRLTRAIRTGLLLGSHVLRTRYKYSPFLRRLFLHPRRGKRILSTRVLSALFLFNSFWLCDSFPSLPRCSVASSPSELSELCFLSLAAI